MSFKNNTLFREAPDNAWQTQSGTDWSIWKVQDSCYIVVQHGKVYGPFKRESEAMAAGYRL